MKSKDIIKIENLNRDGNNYIIRWNLTYLCNYSCDFCIQGDKKKHAEKSKKESIKIRTKICDNLIKFIESELNHKYDSINLYLIGGEVTILKDFINTIEKIVNCKFEGKITFVITTNLSCSLDTIKKLVSIFNKKYQYIRELYLSASYYKEFANEEEFISKIKILLSNHKVNRTGIKFIYRNLKKMLRKFKKSKTLNKIKNKVERVNVNIGYPIANDDEYREYLKFKHKYKNITNNIHSIIIKRYKTAISDKLKKKIVKDEKQRKNIKVTFNNGEIYYCENNNKISLKLDGEESFNSKGYLCDIGMNNISINNIGNISRCPSSKKNTTIGNMVDGNFKLPTEKIICKTENCNCSYYHVIEKNNRKK